MSITVSGVGDAVGRPDQFEVDVGVSVLAGSVAEVRGTRRRAARLRIERVVLPREWCCMHLIAHQAVEVDRALALTDLRCAGLPAPAALRVTDQPLKADS